MTSSAFYVHSASKLGTYLYNDLVGTPVAFPPGPPLAPRPALRGWRWGGAATAAGAGARACRRLSGTLGGGFCRA
eukprot:COSAG01_NODE_37896_length_497_cov_1.095477_1_plen_74_part_10